MGDHPLKIGVKLGPASERTLKRAAEEAERAGFDSIWLSERVAVPLDRPHPYRPLVDPWIGLAFVAAITERVTRGTSVSQIAPWRPADLRRRCKLRGPSPRRPLWRRLHRHGTPGHHARKH